MNDDFLPGAGSFVDPPGSVDIGEIRRLIDSAEKDGTELLTKVATGSVAAFDQAKDHYGQFYDNFMGGIGNHLDKAASLMSKPQEKILTSVRGSLGDAYSQMATYGLPFPTNEQVSYGNKTGDYLGSVGLSSKAGGILAKTDPDKGPLPCKIPPCDGETTPPEGIPPPTPIIPPGTTPIPPPGTITPPPTGTQPPGTQPPGPQPSPNGTQPPGTQPPPTDTQPPGIVPVDIVPLCPPGTHLEMGRNGQWECVADTPPQPPPGPQPSPLPQPMPNCPPGSHAEIDLNGNWTCVIDPPPPSPQPQPEPSGEECEIKQLPTSLYKCGVLKPPEPVLVYYLFVECNPQDDCKRYCIYSGGPQPEAPPGYAYCGRFNQPPDLPIIMGCAADCGLIPPPPKPEPVPQPGPQPQPEPKPEPEPGKQPDGSEVCKAIEDMVNRIADSQKGFCDYIKMNGGEAEVGTIAGQVIQALTGAKVPLLPDVVKRFCKWIEETMHDATKGIDCDRGMIAPVVIWRAIWRLFDKFTGTVPTQLLHQTEIASNTICQHNLPDAGMSDVGWLRGTINDADWECYQKAAGNHIEPAKQVRDAGRAKLDPSQLDKLFRRKLIDDATYRKLSREAGVTKTEDLENIHKANQQFPTLSDVVMLMQRDVGDEINVDWSEADKLLEQKYKGKIQDWFDANGVDKETAKMYWRAHFHLPSLTMGSQMLWRLRPDAPNTRTNFDVNDLRNMLLQDDWHPAFVDRMIDIAYRPITTSDAVKAYMIYAIDDNKLSQIFQDNGRTKESAEFYVQYHKKNREISVRRKSGFPTFRQLVNQYARCEITKDQYEQTVTKLAMSDEQSTIAVEAAVLSRQIRERRDAITAVKRQYVRGTIDDGEASALLDAANVDTQCVTGFLETWGILRLRQDKHATAKELCEMRWYGIISLRQQVEALIRIGFAEEDSIMIAALCTANLDEKKRKQIEKANEKALRELRRQQREAEKARRLAECGPPACPRNTPGGSQTSAGGRRNLRPGSNGTASTSQNGQ